MSNVIPRTNRKLSGVANSLNWQQKKTESSYFDEAYRHPMTSQGFSSSAFRTEIPWLEKRYIGHGVGIAFGSRRFFSLFSSKDGRRTPFRSRTSCGTKTSEWPSPVIDALRRPWGKMTHRGRERESTKVF